MWFKCNEHPEHKSELKSIQHFTSGQEGSMNCKQCNSMGQYIIDYYGEEFLWSVWSDKNIILPFEIAPRSNKKYSGIVQIINMNLLREVVIAL